MIEKLNIDKYKARIVRGVDIEGNEELVDKINEIIDVINTHCRQEINRSAFIGDKYDG